MNVEVNGDVQKGSLGFGEKIDNECVSPSKSHVVSHQ